MVVVMNRVPYHVLELCEGQGCPYVHSSWQLCEASAIVILIL